MMAVQEQLEDDRNFYFFCELMAGGELNDRLMKKKRFEEREASYIVR